MVYDLGRGTQALVTKAPILTRIRGGAVALLLLASSDAAMGQSAGSFIPAPPMVSRRAGHTATLLLDGTVLIAGGTAPPRAHSIAVLFDPLTATFTRTGEMIFDHLAPVAVLLADSKALIVEGRDFACETAYPAGPCGGAELYDP